MAMSYIWSFFLLFSLLCAVLTGRTQVLAAAAMQGAQQGVSLCVSLAGALCLWSGVSRVMERCGLTECVAQLFSPLLARLFPQTFRDREARGCLSANFSANLLGLGSAATPMGVQCVRRMQALSTGPKDRAGNEMCRLIVLNTASFQLLPTTVAALRAGLGADRPFEILPAVWLSSICSVAVGLLAAVCMEGRS